jgi:hypothetical protein
MFEPVESRRWIIGQGLYASIWIAITSIAVFLSPSPAGHGTHQELGLPPCPCVLLFNRPCPGCGLTTSFTALVHGRFRDAFQAHWLGPLLYLIFTVTAIASGVAFIRKQRFDTGSPKLQRPLVIFTVIFVIYGVARFLLMPHYQTGFEAAMSAQLKGH